MPRKRGSVRSKHSASEEPPLKKRNEKRFPIESKDKPLCKYGSSCYRKNPEHLANFNHPKTLDTTENQEAIQDEKHHDELQSNQDAKRNAKSVHLEQTEVKVVGSNSDVVEKDKASLSELPASIQEQIKLAFLVDMPEDFYSMWEFLNHMDDKNPSGLLESLLGLELVGPFQLLKREKDNPSNVTESTNSWRFYYDPPEFQTVIVGDKKKGFHLGYFRDSPKEMPCFVGSNTESDGCLIKPTGENLFAAISQVITNGSKTANPFMKTKLQAFQSELVKWANEKEFPLQAHTQRMKDRDKKVVAKTFYGCGIVVPYDKKTKVGYREIPETNANLKKILNKIIKSKTDSERDRNFDPLQELVNNVQYANDECDWGMGLELGLDLLAFGGEALHSTILHLLSVAYDLLERREFIQILKVHLNNRLKLGTVDS
nr:EOG090X0BAY [Cyclestheria hislopi]